MGDKSATFRFHKADIGDCGLAVGAMGFLKTDPRARQPSPPRPNSQDFRHHPAAAEQPHPAFSSGRLHWVLVFCIQLVSKRKGRGNGLKMSSFFLTFSVSQSVCLS